MNIYHHISRAELLMERRRYDAAMKELYVALENDPENPDVYEALSWCCYNQKLYEAALEWARKVVAASPDYYGGYYYMAVNHASLGRLEEAKKNINEAIGCNHQWAPVWGFKARLLGIEDRWKEAEEAARKGLEFDPDSAVCLQELNAALTKMRAKAKLNESLKISLERNPDDAATHISVGWSLLETGKIKEARTHFEAALAKDPEEVLAQEGMLEAVKAKNLLYRFLIKFDFAVAAQTYESRRAIMIIATVFFIALGVGLITEWALLLIPLSMVVLMMWFVKWLGNMGVYFFNKRYRFLVKSTRPDMSDAVSQGFSLALFIACAGFILVDVADFKGFFLVLAADVFVVTLFWRRYYLHIQTAPEKNARVFTTALTVIAILILIGHIINDNFGWLGALTTMAFIYLLVIDKVFSWRVFNR